MDRLVVLKKAKKYAYQQIDDSSYLSDACLKNIQKDSNGLEDLVCLTLAKKFLEKAVLDMENTIREEKNIPY